MIPLFPTIIDWIILKTLWNIQSKNDSLWIKWIHSKYLKGVDIWEINSKMRDSPLIKNILAIGDRILLDCAGDIDRTKTLLRDWFANKRTLAAYEHLRNK